MVTTQGYNKDPQYIQVGRAGTYVGNKPADDAWWEQDLADYAKNKSRAAQYDAIDKQYSTGITGDGTSANKDYSYSSGEIGRAHV